ncbi:MAG: nucleoside deaminase [Opitutales bacterium]|nr:nucleoside deaminase [Opitutales bacterium]
MPKKSWSAADESAMQEAFRLSLEGMRRGEGGPFGAVVVKDGEIVASAWNEVLKTNDPTAHAEVTAIRRATAKLGRFDLHDCVLYTSCEPCPMCLGAAYWARISKVYYANTQADAAEAGFSDQFIYEEIARPLADRQTPFLHLPQPNAKEAFHEWQKMVSKQPY